MRQTIAAGVLVAVALGLACERDKGDASGPAAAAAAAEPQKAEPQKAEPQKAEPVKAEPAKAEPQKAEPVKAEPVNVEPVKAEPPAPPVVPPGPYVETIAGLRLGMTLAEATAVVPTLAPKSELSAVTPNSSVPGPETYYARNYAAGDLSIVVAAKHADGELRVQWIYANYSATAATSRGVAMGDKAAAFKKAYPKRITPLPGEHWIRFSDDEMLVVVIDAGRVYSMHLGPAMHPDDLEE